MDKETDKNGRIEIEKLQKKVKFALILKNEEEARTLKEIKKYFDLNEMMECFIDNKLFEWLDDRGYEDKAKEIKKSKGEYEKYLKAKNTGEDVGDEIPKKIARDICTLFTGKVDETAVDNINIEEIAALAEKDDYIKTRTDDTSALKDIKHTVRNNDEFHQIVKKRAKKNYHLLANNEWYTMDFDEGYFENRFEGVTIGDQKAIVEICGTKEQINGYRKKFKSIFSNITLKFKDKNKSGAFKGEGEGELDIKKDSYILLKQTESIREKDDSYTWVEGQITRYVDAGFPMLYINTFEEDKVDEIVTLVTEGRYDTLEWSALGLSKKDKNGDFLSQEDNLSLDGALNLLIDDFRRHIDQKGAPGCTLYKTIFVIKDAKESFQNAVVIAKLKYLAQAIYQGYLEDTNIIIVADDLKIPRELEKYLTIVPLGYLGKTEIINNIKEFCKYQNIKNEPTGEFLDKLATALSGLSEFDIVNNLRFVLSGDNELKQSDIKLINEQKKQAVKKTNILEMIDVNETEDDIGGLKKLTEWLKRKAVIFQHLESAKKDNVAIPKGVLIAGMPGCGKSLCAKATATMLDLPLLRMDMGRIMGKYVGESEANMRRAFALSESISPCILWIDEMEKAFSGITDGGASEVTMRLLGSFLIWMQEKTAPVFVVATANDITKMPPELLRKGRFDDIFYVDLPNFNEREAIFRIHIKKRYASAIKDFDETKFEILKDTRGFSGADIEGVVREAAELTFIEKKINIEENDFQESAEVLSDSQKFMKNLRNAIDENRSYLKSNANLISKFSKFYKDNQYKKASEDMEKSPDDIGARFERFRKRKAKNFKIWCKQVFSRKKANNVNEQQQGGEVIAK